MLVCNNSLIGSNNAAVLLILIHSVCNLPFYICTPYIERNHSIRKERCMTPFMTCVTTKSLPLSTLDHNTNCVIHNAASSRWACSPPVASILTSYILGYSLIVLAMGPILRDESAAVDFAMPGIESNWKLA